MLFRMTLRRGSERSRIDDKDASTSPRIQPEDRYVEHLMSSHTEGSRLSSVTTEPKGLSVERSLSAIRHGAWPFYSSRTIE